MYNRELFQVLSFQGLTSASENDTISLRVREAVVLYASFVIRQSKCP